MCDQACRPILMSFATPFINLDVASHPLQVVNVQIPSGFPFPSGFSSGFPLWHPDFHFWQKWTSGFSFWRPDFWLGCLKIFVFQQFLIRISVRIFVRIFILASGFSFWGQHDIQISMWELGDIGDHHVHFACCPHLSVGLRVDQDTLGRAVRIATPVGGTPPNECGAHAHS